MPAKPKPVLTPRQKAILKKTTSVDGRINLGFARDAKTGKLVKIKGKLNAYEEGEVRNFNANLAVKDIIFRGFGGPTERKLTDMQLKNRTDLSRSLARNQRQVMEYKKKIDNILSLSKVKFRVSDVAKNTYNKIIRMYQVRTGGSSYTKRKLLTSSEFMERFNRNLHQSYIKLIERKGTYNLQSKVSMLEILENTVIETFKESRMPDEVYENNFIAREILKKS